MEVIDVIDLQTVIQEKSKSGRLIYGTTMDGASKMTIEGEVNERLE